MIFRGTTPTLIFELPFEATQITTIYITFSQQLRPGTDSRIILEKTLTDVTLEEKKIYLHLTQADTLLLSECTSVEIQIRCALGNGEALASDIIEAPVERILHDGEI